MSNALVRHSLKTIRSHLWRWMPLWLEDGGLTRMYFYPHGGEDSVEAIPEGKRVRVTFELEDDPNADLLRNKNGDE